MFEAELIGKGGEDELRLALELLDEPTNVLHGGYPNGAVRCCFAEKRCSRERLPQLAGTAKVSRDFTAERGNLTKSLKNQKRFDEVQRDMRGFCRQRQLLGCFSRKTELRDRLVESTDHS